MKQINPAVYITLFLVGLLISVHEPHDYFTWMLEVFPAIVGFAVLWITYKRFRFSDLTYILILIHCYILFIGGHYTYAEVPFFEWIKEIFHQSRNNYDKVGHFAQGFVPAAIVREIFIRRRVVKKGFWMAFLSIAVCMTISSFYELLEWGVALLSGDSSDAFLGTQGYVWDTQSDMFYALLGAISLNVFLGKFHLNLIKKMRKARELRGEMAMAGDEEA